VPATCLPEARTSRCQYPGHTDTSSSGKIKENIMENKTFSKGSTQHFNVPFVKDKLSPILSNYAHNFIFGSFLDASSEGTARDGCGSDSFEVFGFLAFGLYLLNLVMNMKRRKRSAGAEHCSSDFNPSREPELVEGVLAFYSMFEGFLNAFYDGKGRR
jgi:hypothetical protein